VPLVRSHREHQHFTPAFSRELPRMPKASGVMASAPPPSAWRRSSARPTPTVQWRGGSVLVALESLLRTDALSAAEPADYTHHPATGKLTSLPPGGAGLVGVVVARGPAISGG